MSLTLACGGTDGVRAVRACGWGLGLDLAVAAHALFDGAVHGLHPAPPRRRGPVGADVAAARRAGDEAARRRRPGAGLGEEDRVEQGRLPALMCLTCMLIMASNASLIC